MLINLLLVYILISGFCIFSSIKRDKLPQKIKWIIVLSDDFNWSTIHRLDTGIKLFKKFPKAKIVVCGKDKSALMKSYLLKNNIRRYIVEDKSTNTYEDVFFLKKMIRGIENEDILLVTSAYHQRRALHTFRKIMKAEIYNYPTNDFLNPFSPMIPTGWVAYIINIIKDFKYNKRII